MITMGWFSRTGNAALRDASRQARAGRLRDRADRSSARGNTARAIQQGVRARNLEAERVPWWRR